MKPYSKFQMGWIMVIVFIPAFIFIYFSFLHQWGNNSISHGGFISLEILMICCVLLFYGMKVRVNETHIRIIYGIGIIAIKIKLDQIKSVEVVRNPWYYGLGIRIIPSGMLYNIHGFSALELTFHDSNRIVRIGSSDCITLREEIMNRINK